MKKVLLTIMMMFLPIMAIADNVAQDIEIGGLRYNINYDTKTAEVNCQGGNDSNLAGDIVIPEMFIYNEETYTVTALGWDAFANCTGITSITMPHTILSIGESSFRGCHGLKSIIIPSSVRSIGEAAFYGCTGLTSMPALPNYITIIGAELFQNCTGLSSVTIPNSVTSIGRSAFEGCTGLTSVTIPNSVTFIDEYAFLECDALTSIVIPNSVTKIGRQAFSWCYSLTSITLGSGLTSIDYGAFEGCDALKEVCSLIQEPFAISYDTFEIYDSQKDTHRFPGTLYIPTGTSGRYRSTDFWSRFERIVDMSVIAPPENEIIVNTESLGSQNLVNSVVDDVYYNLGSDGYDASDGSLIINQPTNLGQIKDAKPGTVDVKNKFTGIIFKVAAGKGTITVKAKTSGNAQLAVKVGNGAPTTASKSEKGDVVVNYDVTEESYVYIYSTVSGSGTRASSNDVVKIYGLTVSPDATGIAEVKREPIVRDRYYTLDGRQVVGKPTAKGIYILNGRKVVVK